MNQHLKQIIETVIPFVERSGLKVIHLESGKAICEMPITANMNHVKSMYAGALFTLADITGGALLLASFDNQRFYPTLKQLNLDFLHPAHSDIHLALSLTSSKLEEMNQSSKEKGKAECILEGDLVDRKGEVIAQMSGCFQIRLITSV